jgi:hypothetical protein
MSDGPVLLLTSMAMGKEYMGVLRRFANDLREGWGIGVTLAGDEWKKHAANHGRFKGWPSFTTGINQNTGHQRYSSILFVDEEGLLEHYLDDEDPWELPARAQRWEDGVFVCSQGNGAIADEALRIDRPVFVIGPDCVYHRIVESDYEDIPQPPPARRPWRKYMLTTEEVK